MNASLDEFYKGYVLSAWQIAIHFTTGGAFWSKGFVLIARENR
jgi:hypothetical protein